MLPLEFGEAVLIYEETENSGILNLFVNLSKPNQSDIALLRTGHNYLYLSCICLSFDSKILFILIVDL